MKKIRFLVIPVLILLNSCDVEFRDRKQRNAKSQDDNRVDQVSIDSTIICQSGIDSAILKADKGEYIFYEFLNPGNKDQKYHQQFLDELNKLEISYQIISLTEVVGGSPAELERSCYLTQMRKEIKSEYGEDWLVSLKPNN